MQLEQTPKADWKVQIRRGKLILSAAVQIMADGSECLHHKAFDLVGDATDYPVGTDDLEGVEFVVSDVDRGAIQ